MAVSSFSDLPKTLRLRAHMSQRGLAEKIGVHRNTIWSWEQGNYLPDSKAFIIAPSFLQPNREAQIAAWEGEGCGLHFAVGLDHSLYARSRRQAVFLVKQARAY
ncbi:hypothetical protein KSF_100580 [Reticulibacter mediterranei]|uniref:HTH cro/C1-type domain-containing protein n=1 Tax=Reticulibacter mediterranei TaxID=2778369 RepID=A0A8J3IWX6_9CHLR|nr:helix-turn-helix transcriptional regulator [Reticulibacter mediterranei]GHP00011.1 hypothetical protein KSF_100580 [Reticulibacter mediterranei]